ncbi:MAG: TonB-dependent receptor plug domain-containing protein [Aliidongia sp.]
MSLRLASSVALIALIPVLAAVPSHAQTADQSAQAAPQTETIQVTGTRIRNTDAQAANPITVVSSEDIAKEKATDVEDILKKLPSIDFSGGISGNSNNGGDGASEIGLRNLGPTRTLVLVNGYRFPNTDTEGCCDCGRSELDPGADDRPYRSAARRRGPRFTAQTPSPAS